MVLGERRHIGGGGQGLPEQAIQEQENYPTDHTSKKAHARVDLEHYTSYKHAKPELLRRIRLEFLYH